MAMLAERKRKQKWSLNPRGKLWAQDNNKFGQKLMEKMGWAPGKGLGAKENGVTEHIKVAYKNDSQGMGYKESDNQWTEHESNFATLLSTLAGEEQNKNVPVKLSSLEEKSQNSKARVHYRKFTRGKDISKYSEKDLANIFGKKSLNEPIKKMQVIEKKEEINEEFQEDKNFSNGGLMSDYFKKKLPNFGNSNDYEVAKHEELKLGKEGAVRQKLESESESETTVNYGFGFKQKSSKQATFVSHISVEEGNNSGKKKNKKKRVLEDSSNVNDTPTKKKKGDKLKKNNEESAGLSNPAFDPLFSPVKVEKHILEPIEENVNESLNDTVGEVAENFEVQVQINNDVTPVKRCKEASEESSSTKKRKKNNSRMMDLDISQQDELVGDTDSKSKRTKKKLSDIGSDENMEVTGQEKKKKKKNRGENSTSDDSRIDAAIEEVNNESHRKKKKSQLNEIEMSETSSADLELKLGKSKRNKKGFEGAENPLFEIGTESENISAVEPDNPYELKVKKKKKKTKISQEESSGLVNPLFDTMDVANDKDIINEQFEVKRMDKGKKKKKQQEAIENSGIDNPALNLNNSIEEACDLMLNIVSTPIIQEVNSPEEQSSIQKVRSLSRRKSVRFSDVTRERIIPNKEDIESENLDDTRDIIEVEGTLNDSSELSHIDKFIQKKKAKKRNKGIDNSAFDQQANNIEENITSMANTIDTFQAEIENDMNEAKMKSIEVEDIMVGEVGNPEGDNEQLPDGSVKLKFKHANFKRTYRYIESLTGPKKSYKHLIKGDIVLGFKESNLHQIDGYATQKPS